MKLRQNNVNLFISQFFTKKDIVKPMLTSDTNRSNVNIQNTQSRFHTVNISLKIDQFGQSLLKRL